MEIVDAPSTSLKDFWQSNDDSWRIRKMPTSFELYEKDWRSPVFSKPKAISL